MNNKKLLSVLLSATMTFSFMGVPAANAESSAAARQYSVLADETEVPETDENGSEIIAHCILCKKGLTKETKRIAPNGCVCCNDCYDNVSADVGTMGEFTDTVAQITEDAIIFTNDKKPFMGAGELVNFFEDGELKVGDTVTFKCTYRAGQKAYYDVNIISAERVSSDDTQEYPVVSYRTRFSGMISPPSKLIYDADEFDFNDLDLSGLTISVKEIKDTRTSAVSGFSNVTEREYKIGKVYTEAYSYESGYKNVFLNYDPQTGKYCADVGYDGDRNKYTVHFYNTDGVLRFSEPDSPDVIHEISDVYDLSFNVYIQKADDKNKFIQIDKKEVVSFAESEDIGNKHFILKDFGEFSLNADSFMHTGYYIREDIKEGDIISGVIYVDPDFDHVICGDLDIVKYAPANGDANCDNSVDMADVVLIMQALANPNKYGLYAPEPNCLTMHGMKNADFDGDGLTVQDAKLIQKKLLGLE